MVTQTPYFFFVASEILMCFLLKAPLISKFLLALSPFLVRFDLGSEYSILGWVLCGTQSNETGQFNFFKQIKKVFSFLFVLCIVFCLVSGLVILNLGARGAGARL